MEPPPKSFLPSSERGRTNSTLEVERARTDDELAQRQSSLDARETAFMRRSRARLEAALRAARASGGRPNERRELVDALDLAWLRHGSEVQAGEPRLEQLEAGQREATAELLDTERRATDQQLLF